MANTYEDTPWREKHPIEVTWYRKDGSERPHHDILDLYDDLLFIIKDVEARKLLKLYDISFRRCKK